MKNLAENHLIRFISIAKRKDGLFANFRVKGLKGGTTFSTSLSVDLSSVEVDATDSLEKIIAACAKKAEKEFQESEVQFEGMLQV